MRRTALVFVLLVAALGLVAAGCGGEEEQSATPETVTGEVTPTGDGDDDRDREHGHGDDRNRDHGDDCDGDDARSADG